MGVYIKGMEMPKTEEESRLLILMPDGVTWLTQLGLGNQKFDTIEVPPHGRLIDADALMLMIQEYIDEYGWDVDEHGFHSEKWCAMKETEMAINDAPTVIPADKDGEA